MENSKEQEKPGQEINKNKHSMLRQGTSLSILTLVSRVLGLLREMTKARFMGTSAVSDAFSVAFMLPNLFRRLFAEGSIAVAFIPTFKEYLIKNDQKENREFLSCIFTFLSFFVTLAVMAGVLAAPLLIRLFSLEEINEAIFLTRIMFPYLAFISIAALFQGILNSLHIFTPSAIAPIILNIVTILCAYFLRPYIDVSNPDREIAAARAMASGVIIGGFLQAAIQLPAIIKNGQRFFFIGIKRAFTNPGTRKVLLLIGPTIIGMAAYQLNDIVSTAIAGKAGEGVVSSLQYSLRLQELILGVFAVSIGTILLPNLAQNAKTERWDVYNNQLISAINIIALITIPITFFSLSGGFGFTGTGELKGHGAALIRLLFQRGSFDNVSVARTLWAFRFHIPGLFFIALNRIIAPAFYAQSDSKSPTIAGIVSFIVNMALAIILVKQFKYPGAGIALALSIAALVNTALLFVFLKKNPNIAVSRAIRSALFYTVKMIVLSALAALPLHWLSPKLMEIFAGRNRFIANGIPLLISVLIFLLIGIFLLAITCDKQLGMIIQKMRRKN